jgi:oligoendopeptidase F
METIAETPRWQLNDLIAPPIEPSLEASLAELNDRVAALETSRPLLTEDIAPDAFMDILHQLEAVDDLASRLGAYGSLRFAEDTQSEAALNLRGRLDMTMTDVSNRTLFIGLWFKSLPDEAAERLMAASGNLRYFLATERRFRPHTLSESEEQIINLKDTNGIDAMMGLYDMISNAFSFEVTVDGETRKLTRGQMGNLYRHPSADVRAATYQELYRVYGDNSTLLAQIYNHRVRDWRNEADLRHFDQPVAYRNLANDLPDAVVDTLLEVCRANNGIYQRYFKLKAGWLGMEKLRRYDIYAPLAASSKRFSFSDAKVMVLDSFTEFSPGLAERAASVFDAGHVDAQIRPGKRSGAFCMGASPRLTPWVHLNFEGVAGDVATMAHELGHAVHSLLAHEHSPLTYHPPLPLAETASIFSERLLTDRLMKQEPDPAVRRDLLAAAIDDAYASVQRQAYIAIFEREAHEMIANGATVEEVCRAYMDSLRDQFGDSLELSDEFQWEWISIPHIFHVPFYTYAYSFGQLLVLALYRQYQQEGEPFVPKFIKLLSYGGSESPMTILSEAGFDISTATFWQGGYDVLDAMITELEQL